MAKSSGGIRGGAAAPPRIVGFKETDKAVQLQVEYSMSLGIWAYGEYFDKQKTSTIKVWVPKSQIENGTLSVWIGDQKLREVYHRDVDWYQERYRAKNIIADFDNWKFTDASGRTVEVKPNKREREQRAKLEQARSVANERRAELIAQAKANGYKAHGRLKTRTLEAMANGTYTGRR